MNRRGEGGDQAATQCLTLTLGASFPFIPTVRIGGREVPFTGGETEFCGNCVASGLWPVSHLVAQTLSEGLTLPFSVFGVGPHLWKTLM